MPLDIDQAERPKSPMGTHHAVTLGAAVFSPQDMPNGARYLSISSHTQNSRYTLDGSTPAATVGFLLPKDSAPVLIEMGTGVIVNIIRESAGAVLQYQWLK